MKFIPRIYVQEIFAPGVKLVLDEAQTNHIISVLRKKISDTLYIFNEEEGEWEAELIEKTRHTCMIELRHQRIKPKKEPDLCVAFAPVKHVKLQWVVEKATELGASMIQPITTQYTMVRSIQETKVQTYAIQAAQQCERLSIPQWLPLKPFDTLLADQKGTRVILYGDETGEGETMVAYSQKADPRLLYTLLVGPEGGFSDEERHMLKEAQAVAISLGPRILKADTAMVALLSCYQACIGDWNMRATRRV